jgi:hypothetical protein
MDRHRASRMRYAGPGSFTAKYKNAMIYDLSNPYDREKFKRRVNALYQRQNVVELSEHKPRRTTPQNSYLHLLLGMFAMETGNTLEFVKQEYFKRLVNPDLFVEHRHDKYLGEIDVLRSSRDLDTGEMTTAIERFRNWSASEADIYLPAPNEQEFLDSIEREMQCRRIWL